MSAVRKLRRNKLRSVYGNKNLNVIWKRYMKENKKRDKA